MIGAIIGDMVGSRYERDKHGSKDFDAFNLRNRMTDDSLLTIDVARVLTKHMPLKYDEESLKSIKKDLIESFANTVRRHRYAGWGHKFVEWALNLNELNYQPYNSFGNGAAMRISPVGWAATSLEEVKTLSKAVTEISHNHPEGLKGAEAISICVFLARNGYTKEQIKDYVIHNYYPEIESFDFDDLVANYRFNSSCQGSVPQAIYAFLISTSFEDTLRNCVAIGGDTDTIGAMAGSIAEAYYDKDKPSEFESKFMYLFFDAEVEKIVKDFHKAIGSHKLDK